MAKRISDEEIIRLFTRDKDIAEEYYDTYIAPKVKEWSDIYNGSEEYYNRLMPNLSAKSKYVSTDTYDTIEYIMPDLMKIFYGGSDVITVQGRTADDEDRAKINQKLANYQINTLNNGYMLFYTWFKDALRYGVGIVKGSWDVETEEEKGETIVNAEQLQQLSNEEGFEVKEINEVVEGEYTGLYRVKYVKSKLLKNQPVLENIKYSEFLFDPESKTIHDAEFVIHRKNVTADYLRRREAEGIYKNVERALENSKVDFTDEYITRRDGYLSSSDNEFTDTPRRKLTLYETYTKMDINNDGLLEDVIISIVGNTVLSVQENTFGTYPFFIISALPEPYQILGNAWANIMKDLQNVKTAIIRQLLVNIALSNEQRKYIREDQVRWEDIINNREFVRLKGNASNPVEFEPLVPIHSAVPMILQYLDSAREQKTGVNQVKMGVNHSVLNHALETATGAKQLFEASNARIQMIARTFSETGVRDLFMWLVASNQRFITQTQVIRLTEESLEIRPDDLTGTFDFIVSGGIGTGMSEMKLQNLNNLLGMSTQVLMNIGLSNPSKIRNIVAAIIEEMGFKDVNKYVIGEEELQQQQMQQQQMQQMQMMQQGQPQGGPPMPPEAGPQGGPPMPPQGEPAQGGAPQGIPPELLAMLGGQG